MREELDFSTMGITDDFMFGTVFQDLGLCRGLVEVLLGIEVRDLRMVERQELVDFGPASRAGIHLRSRPVWTGVEALRLPAIVRAGRRAAGGWDEHSVRERGGHQR